MRFSLCLVLALFLLAAPSAPAATPSVEELHDLLLRQQDLIERQNVRLDALEAELHQQRAMVVAQQQQLLAQQHTTESQTRVVAVLEQRTSKAETEIERVHQTLVSSAPTTQAGPMTASLNPMGAPRPEPDFPYSLTAGMELLIAASDSFRFSSVELANTANEGHSSDGRRFSLGYWLDFAYSAPSGITWGADVHYWSEDDTHFTNDTTDQYVDITAVPFTSDKINATMDATRFYADLYGRRSLHSSNDLRLDILGGLRGGYLGQSIYLEDAGDPTMWVDAETSYWGLGPRIGLALDWDLWRGLSLVADADVALLVGASESKSRDDPGQLVHSRNEQFLDTVWMFNTRLGLDFRSEFARSALIFELGLNAEYWSGIPDYPRNESPADNAKFYDTSMLFLGPYFSVDYEF